MNFKSKTFFGKSTNRNHCNNSNYGGHNNSHSSSHYDDDDGGCSNSHSNSHYDDGCYKLCTYIVYNTYCVFYIIHKQNNFLQFNV